MWLHVGSPDNPGVDIALDNDKAIQQDEVEQGQHAHPIGGDNVA